MNQSHNRTSAEIEQQIYDAIRSVKPSLGAVALTPDTRLDSLGLESIERVSVVFELEEAFDLSILDANLDTFRTVAEARELIEKLLAARHGV